MYLYGFTNSSVVSMCMIENYIPLTDTPHHGLSCVLCIVGSHDKGGWDVDVGCMGVGPTVGLVEGVESNQLNQLNST